MSSGVRTIPFVKASACGNDFLLIDSSLAPRDADIHAFTQRICNRHDGVGADGVEWMLPHPQRRRRNSPDQCRRLARPKFPAMALAASRHTCARNRVKRRLRFKLEPE